MTPRESDARITYLIARVDRGVRSLIDDAVAGFGLTTPQYTAMSVLARGRGLSSAQLARRAFVTPQAMNQIVARLEAESLIVRTPDPGNGRILRARLTPDGARRLAACNRVVDEVEESMLAALDEPARAQLRDGLAACVRALAARHHGAPAEPEPTPVP